MKMNDINDFLSFPIFKEKITVQTIVIIIVMLIVTRFLLNILRNYITKRFDKDDKIRFISAYEYLKYIVYLIVVLITLSLSGVQLTAIIASAAALLLGVGLALQTFFQDIISGLFILMDKSVQVNDIIEIEGKVGRVIHINLRTTKAITIDNKILVVPNHLYLTNTLYNWTQNDNITRESVSIGVAYGSDVALVKKLLTDAALSVKEVIPKPDPLVLFTDFGDSALQFKVIFTIKDSYYAEIVKSNVRFKIDQLFRANNISIPFPQRDVHMKSE